MYTKLERNYNIQFLRGIAVSAVLLFHFSSRFPGGYFGVDLFFVISGYVVIHKIDIDRNYLRSFVKFWKRRFIRLTPAFISTIVFTQIIFLLFTPTRHLEEFNKFAIQSIFAMSNLAAYKDNSSSYFEPNINPYLHFWSLSSEIQIYMFAPIILILFRKKKRKILFLSIFIISFLVSATLHYGNMLELIGVNNPNKFVFYSPILRLGEFFFGASLTFLHRKIQFNSRTVGIILVFAFLFILQPVKYNEINVLLFCILIVPLFRLNDITTKSYVFILLKNIGDRSYSIYLIHLPIKYFLDSSYLTRNIPFNLPSYLLISVLIGNVLYRFIEKNGVYKNKYYGRSLFAFLIVSLLFVISLHFGNKLISKEKIEGIDLSNKTLYNCHGNYSKCILYGSGKEKIFVVGDSHALSILNTLTKSGILNYKELRIYIIPGCEYFASSKENRIHYDSYLKCKSRNEKIRNELSRNEDATIIIYQISSSYKYSRNLNYLQIQIEGYKDLAERSKRLILITPTPEFQDVNFFPPDVQTLFDRVDVKSLESATKLVTNPLSDTKQLHKVFDQINNVKLVETLKIFCDNQYIICERKSKNGWLFYDKDHVTSIGAELIVNTLISKLNTK